MSALKQAIAEVNDETSEDVFVPEWDVTLQVRSLTGQARANIVQNLAERGESASFMALYPELIIQTVYDPDTGALVFEDTEADRALILSKNATALERVAKVSLRMSGLAQESEEEVGKPS